MNTSGRIKLIISGLGSLSDNIVGESTPFTMSDRIEESPKSFDDIDLFLKGYIRTELKKFEMDITNDSPISKTLRLIEDICGKRVRTPIQENTNIFPYKYNREVMVEVFFIPDNSDEYTVIDKGEKSCVSLFS